MCKYTIFSGNGVFGTTNNLEDAELFYKHWKSKFPDEIRKDGF